MLHCLFPVKYFMPCRSKFAVGAFPNPILKAAPCCVCHLIVLIRRLHRTSSIRPENRRAGRSDGTQTRHSLAGQCFNLPQLHDNLFGLGSLNGHLGSSAFLTVGPDHFKEGGSIAIDHLNMVINLQAHFPARHRRRLRRLNKGPPDRRVDSAITRPWHFCRSGIASQSVSIRR